MLASLIQLFFFFLLYLVFKNDTLVNYYDIVLSFEYSSEFLSKQRFISQLIGIHLTLESFRSDLAN